MPKGQTILTNAEIKKIPAFTLAEILITIGIIGIIAAITIPTIINSIKDLQFKSSLKEFFSILENAQNQAIHNDKYIFKLSQYGDILELAKYISMVKTCDRGARSLIINGCWYDDPMAIPYIEGSPMANMVQFYAANFNATAGVLKNGMIFYIDAGYNIIVDVNGFNRPNEFGKDVWSFNFDNNLNKWIPSATTKIPLMN